MGKYLFTIAALLFLNRSIAQPTVAIGATNVIIDTVFTGLDVPWEVIYAPDKHLWITERMGKVSRINPITKTRTVILNLGSAVYAQSETGLLGMALDPGFAANNFVYLVYNFGTGFNTYERLVKYTYSAGQLGSPQILIDSIPGAANHDGSRLLFLPDNTLLMTTGDALNAAWAQNMNSKAGKVLRLNTNGTIPASNPFPNSYVYSFGHRNAQGMMMAPNGKVYISEHGPNNDDEFQELIAGRNYGWPNVEGFCNTASEFTFCTANNVKEPIFGWTPTIAPSDLTWYSNPGLPEFDGGIIMAVLKDKKLVSLKLDAAGTGSVSQNSYLVNQYGRIRDVCVGPFNEIYFATNGNGTGNDANTHSIMVLKPNNPVSVAENSLENLFTVYPNPATDQLHIKGSGSTAMSISLTDLLGKRCIQRQMDVQDTTVSLAGIEKGVYFLSVEENGKVIYRSKIVVSGK